MLGSHLTDPAHAAADPTIKTATSTLTTRLVSYLYSIGLRRPQMTADFRGSIRPCATFPEKSQALNRLPQARAKARAVRSGGAALKSLLS